MDREETINNLSIMKREETIKRCWIASIVIVILFLVACVIASFYLPPENPVQHHDHQRDHGEHNTLKRSVADLHLNTVFKTMDTNNDDFITKQEVMESLKHIGIPMKESEVDDMIRRVDANGDGLIDLNEFCTLFDGSLMSTETEFKETFDVFDSNGDGFITAAELGLVFNALGFKEGNKMGDCKEMIKHFDLDGDGKINFLEFKKMMIKSGYRLVPIN